MHYWASNRNDLHDVYRLLQHRGLVPSKMHFREALPHLRARQILVYKRHGRVLAAFIAANPYPGNVTFDIVKSKTLPNLPAKAFKDFLVFLSQYPVIMSTAASRSIEKQLLRLGFVEVEDGWFKATNQTIRIP